MENKDLSLNSEIIFEIDAHNGEIKNKLSANVSVNQYNHNCERFNFLVPKVFKGHDISSFDKTEIHYINFDTKTKEETFGVYQVEDLKLCKEEERVSFSWLLSQTATKNEGVLSFAVRFSKFDEKENTLSCVLNTKVFHGVIVSKGIYNGEVVIEKYSDVLRMWEEKLFSLNNEGIKNISTEKEKALKEIKETIPENYNAFTETMKENKADAIVLESQKAKSFVVNDSGNYLLQGLSIEGKAESPSIRVLGKNLFDVHIDKEVSRTGVEIPTYITKPIRVSALTNNLEIEGNAVWRISATFSDGKMAYVMDYGAAANYFPVTIKATEENPIVSIGYRGIRVLSGSYDVQVELGTTETEFVPYVEKQEVVIPYSFEEGDSLRLENGAVKTFIGGVETDITDTECGQALLKLKTNYPDTTILCDANCKVTYKADTTNAYYNLKQAILNLGGTI